MREEKRPREFVAALDAIPDRVKAVKKLYAVGIDDDERKLVLAYTTPATLMFRITAPPANLLEAKGKEVLRFETDGKVALTYLPKKRPRRERFKSLPDDAPRLARLLLSPGDYASFGLPDGDETREYAVQEKTWEGRAVLRLGYTGSDDIGRGQEGELLLDKKTGLPVRFQVARYGNSPRDDGDFYHAENWATFEVTR